MADLAIKRLGTFLADLTQDKPPDQMHQEILVRLRDPQQALDHRLAGIYLQVKDFVPVWTAIRNGVSLPTTSWETVVLPAVVHYSAEQNLKANLEAATNLWLTARGTRVIEPAPADASPESVSPEPETGAPAEAPAEIEAETDAVLEHILEPQSSSPRRRRWVPQTAAVAIVAVAAALIWGGGNDRTKVFEVNRPPVTQTSVPEPTPSPSEEPAPSPQASAAPSGTPAASASMRPPGAPTALAVTGRTQTSIALSWRAPSDSGNVAYYRVFRNGTEAAQTMQAQANLTGLAASTGYTFTVRAYNRSGMQSAPSNAVTIRTLDPPPPPPPTLKGPGTVAFGDSFTLNGTAFPCADVQVFIGGQHVANASVSGGGFSAAIDVHEHDGVDGYVDIIGSTEMLQLTAGSSWETKARCGSGAGDTDIFNVA